MWWVYGILSAFFAGLATVCTKAFSRHVDESLAAAMQSIIPLILTWGILLAAKSSPSISSISRRSLLLMLVPGLALSISWICYFKAIKQASAAFVASIDVSSFVFSLILSAIILGESFCWKKCIGCLLIGSGSILLILQR